MWSVGATGEQGWEPRSSQYRGFQGIQQRSVFLQCEIHTDCHPLLIELSDNLGRDTDCNTIRRDILRHDGSGPDDRPCADGNTRHDDAADSIWAPSPMTMGAYFSGRSITGTPTLYSDRSRWWQSNWHPAVTHTFFPMVIRSGRESSMSTLRAILEPLPTCTPRSR